MKSILSIVAMTASIFTVSLQSQAGQCTYTGRSWYYSLVVEYNGPGSNRATTCNYYKKDDKANWYYRCVDGSHGHIDRNTDDESNLIHSRAGRCQHLGLF